MDGIRTRSFFLAKEVDLGRDQKKVSFLAKEVDLGRDQNKVSFLA